MRSITVWNLTRGLIVGTRIDVAETCLARVIGLLGKPDIAPGGGLLIAPSSGVHTIGMRFAIDVVGLDARFRVLRLWPRLMPFRLTAVNFKVRSVLELAVGQIAATGIRLGDDLQVDANAAQSP